MSVRRLLLTALLAASLAAAAVAGDAVTRAVALDLALVALGALVVSAVLDRLTRSFGPVEDAAWRPPPVPAAVRTARRWLAARSPGTPVADPLTQLVVDAGRRAGDAHYRLRPRLRRLAAALLAARRGIDLDREPDRARDVLGEEAWALVDPGRPPPDDRSGPGIPSDRMATVVEALERV